jgi:hypothetical protein
MRCSAFSELARDMYILEFGCEFTYDNNLQYLNRKQMADVRIADGE